MKTIIAVAGALISCHALSKAPDEASAPPAAGGPVSLLGYAIGQKLGACPEGSKVTVHDQRRLCSLGPTTYAGAKALDHSITLFNGEVIGAHVTLDVHAAKPGPRVLADLQARFGAPDGAYSRPDLHSHVWVRGAIVMHYDGITGSVLITDVIKTEVAKLRAAPSNQVDF